VAENKLFHVQANWLAGAIEALGTAGAEVLVPVRDDSGLVDLRSVTSSDHVASDYCNVLRPLKEVFLPRTEVLMKYEKGEDGDVRLSSTPPPSGETVVMGSRPCDAAAVEMLDKVFQWDYDDVPYRTRRENTTVVSWACTAPDARCFCTSVGGSPQDERGSDVLVFLQDDGKALLQVHTEKGTRFIERLGDIVQPAPADMQPPEPPEIGRTLDTDKIKRWLDDNFESEFWTDISLKCLGCGACSYLCPTCHCFDIVDESVWNRGERRRNWDSCSFSLFTQHTSGHNPRPDQTARCRQRVMHKFKYFPERFNRIACVGCGRCIRNCGVGQNIVQVLAEIERQ
jgi:sulfhydrogenase subunit beta (sulfur reductase)